MRKLRLVLLPALLVALSLGLAACGGGGDGGGAEDKIASAIETAATGNDPAVCEETQTLAFMEQTTGGKGKQAEKTCEAEAEAGENQPDSVKVGKIQVDGGKASADAEFKGGQFDDQTLELALVEEGGDWKLDEFSGFANFDPAPFIAALREQLEEEPEIEGKTADCIVKGIEGLSNSELESIVVENNTDQVVEIAESCQ